MSPGGFLPPSPACSRGARSVPPALIDPARIPGATPRQTFFRVILPAAAPGMCNGPRVGLTLDRAHLVVAAMPPGGTSGMGCLICDAGTWAAWASSSPASSASAPRAPCPTESAGSSSQKSAHGGHQPSTSPLMRPMHAPADNLRYRTLPPRVAPPMHIRMRHCHAAAGP